MSVAWVSAGVGAYSIYSANKNSKRAQQSADASIDAASKMADSSVALGREQLDFTRQQYDDSKPLRDAAAATSQRVANAQIASQEQQDALAKEYADYARETFRPLEKGIVSDAETYDTPERRRAAAEAAMADVQAQIGRVDEGRSRQLAASGVNPGSARAIAAMAGQDVEAAKAIAGAGAGARRQIETTGFARKMDAASLGRNLASNQATAAGVAINAGNSAVSNSLNGINASNAGLSGMQAGYSGAIGANNGAASLFQQNARTYQSIADSSSAALGGVGNAIGRWAATEQGGKAIGNAWDTVAGWFPSDVNMKEDIEEADPEEALEEVRETPVSNWRYSPSKLAEKGIDVDGPVNKLRTGPMAQDVQENMGDEAGPGGTKIDLVTLNGKNMLAIQALDKKVNKIASLLQAGKLGVNA